MPSLIVSGFKFFPNSIFASGMSEIKNYLLKISKKIGTIHTPMHCIISKRYTVLYRMSRALYSITNPFFFQIKFWIIFNPKKLIYSCDQLCKKLWVFFCCLMANVDCLFLLSDDKWIRMSDITHFIVVRLSLHCQFLIYQWVI